MNLRRTTGILATALLMGFCVSAASAEGTKEKAASAQPIKIELIQQGWLNVQNDFAKDPYQAWIDKTFGVNFTLTSTRDFNNIILVRFASSDHPDMINFNGNKTLMESVYNQGVLLPDWAPYLSKMPTIDAAFPKEAKLLFTQKGKLVTLSRQPEMNLWSFKIRKDWLAKLGLQVPTTDKELLEVGRKITSGDPDGNGKNDTFAFTSSGGGKTLGEIEQLANMYSPTGFYIGEKGTVEHAIINGSQKKFYDFMKTVVKEKLIDPDWYTQGWAERKPALFKGMFGVVWYPGVLINEIEGGTGNTGNSINWWSTINTPVGAPGGGKRASSGVYGTLVSASMMASKDSVKFNKILEILEATSFPNDGFWKLRWGVEIDNFKVSDITGGFKYIDVLGKPGVHYRGGNGNMGGWDWGTWLSPGRHDRVVEGTVPTPGVTASAVVALDTAALALPSYPIQDRLLNLDAALVQTTNDIKYEFEIKYILGETDDYQGFVSRWLSAGGQKLLDAATAQYRALGMVK